MVAAHLARNSIKIPERIETLKAVLTALEAKRAIFAGDLNIDLKHYQETLAEVGFQPSLIAGNTTNSTSIDNVLVSHHFKCREAQVLKNRYGSDHFPVQASLSITI